MSQLTKIRFHEIHGNDIMVHHKYTTARRTEVHDNGLVFTSQPIKPLQKISIKLLEVSDKLPGIISVGFTSHDPATLRSDLPKSTKSDLKKKQGFWICSLSKQHCFKGGVLFFYVGMKGDIHFGVDGEEKGCFEKKVDTGGRLWGLVDIWSPLTVIQVQNPHSHTPNKPSIFCQLAASNLKISGNRVQKRDDEVGYAFMSGPLPLEKCVQVRFLCDGKLALGVTSCDPTLIQHAKFPANPDALLDRSEYWVVVDDPTWSFALNDELSYSISVDGEMKIWKNSSLLLKKFHVDQTAKLWGFFVLQTVEKIEVTVVEGSVAPSARKEETHHRDDSHCKICCDEAVEAVLYPCGHMCMCVECAQRQWHAGGDGHCPLCRVKIRDVLKVYKA